MSQNASQSFYFEGVDSKGKSRRGQHVAASRAQALSQLAAEGITVTRIQQKSAGASPAGLFRGRKQIKRSDQAQLLSEIASLLEAGVSLAELTPSLAAAWSKHPLGLPLAKLDRALQSGKKLGDTFDTVGFELPPHIISLVRAGEASGQLGSAFADASRQLEYEDRLAKEFRSALVYPSLLIAVGIAAVLTILMVVVPRFAGMLGPTSDIPELSRMVIGAGVWMQSNGFVVLGVAIAVVIALAMVWQSPDTQRRVLGSLSKMPVVGPWLINSDIGRWATLLGTLTQQRVPLLEALLLSKGALKLPQLEHAMADAQVAIRQGRALSAVLAEQGWIPETRLNLLKVGERAGELPAMLLKLGDLHSNHAREQMKRVLALIEPIAILLIGGAVGFIMLAVMLTLTSIGPNI